jgi:Patatin-like phospholipase
MGTDREFQIGLTMSGAISAGAYTAGVLDFLVEALDTWDEARKGPRPETVPGHRVGLKVMSGASAGAITAAIAAVALVDGEADGKRKAPGVYLSKGFSHRYYLPKLYETWVVRPTLVAETAGMNDFLTLTDLGPTDPTSLLSTAGVPETGRLKQGTVASVLNARLLDEIANAALKVDHLVNPRTPYVSDNLHIYLTLANLRGVPYKVPFKGGDYHMIAHGDRVHYSVSGVGTWGTKSPFADNDKQRRISAETLVRGRDPNWTNYAVCALASSAFPVGLAPRQIDTRLDFDAPANPIDEYGKRLFPDADLIGSPNIVPNWDPRPSETGLYWFTSADGGIIDNDPFEYAHFSLKDVDEANFSFANGVGLEQLEKRIPSDPDVADRAVIMISPFPEAKPILAEGQPGLDIVSLFTALMPALIDQARFKPGQLALALDENHGSRYLVGPRRDGLRYAIASGLLDGFGGFVSRSFRDFDYQLGRRNCQMFLRSSFAVPPGNPIVTGWGPAVDRGAFRALPNDRDGPPEPPAYVLIPLYGSTATEVKLPPWPRISETEFETLLTRIAARFDRIAPLIITQSVSGFLGMLFKFALLPGPNAVVDLIRGKILGYVRMTILADLVRRNQIAGWDLPEAPGDPAKALPLAVSDDYARLVLAELLDPKFDVRSATGIQEAIGRAAAPKQLLTLDFVQAVLDQFKGATGKPYQVWEAGWKGQAAGQGTADVSLYTLMSRKPWWADPLTNGRYVALVRRPSSDLDK